MKREGEKHREPRFHLVKRDSVPFWQSAGIRAVAIILAVGICSLIVFLAGHANPVRYFRSMFKGAFGTSGLTWSYLYSSAILLCIALAVTPAFKMRFWNIGAEGQVLMGGLATTACMFFLGGKIPQPLLYLCMLGAGLLAGALWAVIPAIFKAKWNTNETLFTLMMNYIAIQLVAFCIDSWVKTGSGTLSPMHRYGFPRVYNEWLMSIIIVAALAVGMFIYLKYSKHGYELTVVGESENTARYIGIPVKKVIIRTMLLSGALCGLAGLITCGGMDHTISVNSAGGRGFTAILVSWLAKFNPFYMVLTALLVEFFRVGALQVSTDLRIDDLSDVSTAIILFFIVGCEFFIRYKIVPRKAEKEARQ